MSAWNSLIIIHYCIRGLHSSAEQLPEKARTEKSIILTALQSDEPGLFLEGDEFMVSLPKKMRAGIDPIFYTIRQSDYHFQ
jgi:hypothetical protein